MPFMDSHGESLSVEITSKIATNTNSAGTNGYPKVR